VWSSSPSVIGRGGDDPSSAASHTAARVMLAATSARDTTNATCVPSGERAGPLACTVDPMMWAAMSR